MKKEITSSKKAIIILTSLIIALVMALTVITLAWFTDSANFNSGIEFGVVQLDTSSGPSTQTALSKSVTRSIGEIAENGKVMPGDTITFSMRVKLTSTSEPAYYLVKVAGTNALSSLTTDYYYYVNNSANATVSKSATGNTRTCGAITASDTHTLTIPFVIPTSYTEQGLIGNITCTVAVIQQVNITIGDAYDELKNELDPPVLASVTLSSSSLDPYVGSSATTTELGFYHTAPAGYVLDNLKTTAIQSTVAGDDTTAISVYTKDTTKIAIVCSGTIYAPASCMGLFWNTSTLNSISFDNFDTSNTTSISAVFSGCSSLTSLNLSGWNTSNFETLNSVFNGCSSLVSLDLTNWAFDSWLMCDGTFTSVNSNIVITCSSDVKNMFMNSLSGPEQPTLTNANFNVV